MKTSESCTENVHPEVQGRMLHQKFITMDCQRVISEA